MPAIGLSLLLDFNNQADCTALVLALACLLLPISYAFWHEPAAGRLMQVLDGPALWPIGLFVWALLSSQWSAFPHGTILHAVPLALWLSAYLATRVALRTLPVHRLLFMFAIAACAAAAAQITEFAWTGLRADGWFIDPNSLAGLLNALFFPLFFWHLRARIAGQPFRALALAMPLLLLFGSLTLSLSTSGLIAFLLGMAATLSLVVFRYRALAAAALPLLLALGLSFAVLQQVDQGEHRSPLQRAANLAEFTKEASVYERGMLYRAAWALYREQPVLGRGFGTFSLLYPQVREPKDASAGSYVHSDPLQMLLEGGPLLLLLFLGPAVYTARLLWRNRELDASNSAQDLPRLIGLGCAIGLCCLYLQSVVTFVFYQCAVAVTAGFLLATLQSTLASRTNAAVAQPVGRMRRISLFAGLLGLWGYLGYVAIDSLAFITWSKESHCQSAWCRHWQLDVPAQHKLAQLFATLQPDAPAPRLSLVSTSLALYEVLPADHPQRASLLELALTEATELVRRQPELPQSHYTLASLLARYPELAARLPADLKTDVERLYLRTLALDPLLIQAYLDLYDVYAARADYRKGYDLLVDGALRWFSPMFMTPEQAEAVLFKAMQAAIQLQQRDDARDLAKALLNGAPYHREAREYLRLNP